MTVKTSNFSYPRITINLQGWINECTQIPSPHFNERPDITDISLLVIHNISLPPNRYGGNYITDLFMGQLDPAEDPYFENIYKMEVSSHFMIRRTGEIIQYVSLFSRAWHAGKSYFDGRENCNDFSIGIELEGTDTDPYTDNQYSSLITLTEAIRSKFPRITKKRITGHCNIAPERKTDPGESFNWNFYLNHLSN